jgi:hypothetical protein
LKLLGLYINRDIENVKKSSYVTEEPRDGSLDVNPAQVGFTNQTLSVDGVGYIEDDTKLITKYRELALQTEIDEGIQDIVNEAFSYDENSFPVEINLDDVPKELMSEKIKDKIRDEFKYILNLMNFKQDCYERFKDWYVDGRIFYETVVDKNKPDSGIIALTYIDPRKIKRVRELSQEKSVEAEFGAPLKVKQKFYYAYNPIGIMNNNVQNAHKLSPDQIAYAHSGLTDKTGRTILSYLHAAIRPYNQYMNMKNSMIIYYHTRAPERRVFNIEVGNLPTGKANQYVQEVINKHRRNEVYDPNSGSVSDSKRYMTMQEDYWFPKRDGKGTSVDSIQGGANLQEINDVVQMYKDELYRALRLPMSRYKDGGGMFNMGRSSEISRDELKFGKFIARLRKRFSIIFDEILGRHLVLKNIMTLEEWEDIKSEISYDYLQDSHFTELKNAEIWTNRVNNLRDAEAYIGTYFSKRWAVENFLHLSEEEWEEMKKEIEKEHKEDPPMDELGNPAPGHPDFGKQPDPEEGEEQPDDQPDNKDDKSGKEHTLKIKLDKSE